MKLQQKKKFKPSLHSQYNPTQLRNLKKWIKITCYFALHSQQFGSNIVCNAMHLVQIETKHLMHILGLDAHAHAFVFCWINQ